MCNTIVSTHFYILWTSVKHNWRITSMYPWEFWEIQDGCHSPVKTQFWIISPIVTSYTSFPANLRPRNSFLNLFCQSEVNAKVKGQVQGHCMPNLLGIRTGVPCTGYIFSQWILHPSDLHNIYLAHIKNRYLSISRNPRWPPLPSENSILNDFTYNGKWYLYSS